MILKMRWHIQSVKYLGNRVAMYFTCCFNFFDELLTLENHAHTSCIFYFKSLWCLKGLFRPAIWLTLIKSLLPKNAVKFKFKFWWMLPNPKKDSVMLYPPFYKVGIGEESKVECWHFPKIPLALKKSIAYKNEGMKLSVKWNYVFRPWKYIKLRLAKRA